MSTQYATLKGFADLYGRELAAYTLMEATARRVFTRSCYEEIRPPLLEATSLFQRGIGEETDVVRKEMFTFYDRKGRSITLRPEATAGVLRAAIEGGLARPGHIARLYTIGPMFRYERPQKGRMRQFHQINAECLGSDSPFADAGLICMLMEFLNELGLGSLVLKLNSLGCRKCRPAYLKLLKDYFKSLKNTQFCDDCQRRMETNPLRVLDCKTDQTLLAEAPKFLDHICEECKTHFWQVRELLDSAALPYELAHHLVRGLDYYCRTTFEVVSGSIGAQTAVAGGGRYDGLVAQLGGHDIPGAGFACGMERLALLVESVEAEPPDFYILGLDGEARNAAWLLAHRLHQTGYSGEINYADASLKSLMRQVTRSGARFCLLIGPDEMASRKITVKNMQDGSQTELMLDNAIAEFEAICKK